MVIRRTRKEQIMIPLDRYPKEITLRNGERLILRAMTPKLAGDLWDFYRRLPETDKAHFEEDVDSRESVERWARALDFDIAFPLLALHGGRVVGSVTLYRNRAGWKQRIGTVRILIDPEYRNRGIGTILIREIRLIGEKTALNYLVVEVIEEQQSAIQALERMGFERKAVYRKFVNDRSGKLHDLVEMLYSQMGPEDEILY
jgi:RimJ/RimL family protein N-acetyltransferase